VLARERGLERQETSDTDHQIMFAKLIDCVRNCKSIAGCLEGTGHQPHEPRSVISGRGEAVRNQTRMHLWRANQPVSADKWKVLGAGFQRNSELHTFTSSIQAFSNCGPGRPQFGRF
jgi:hypothetical protein